MHLVDHVFILLLFLVQPIYGAIESRRILARAKAGEPVDRIRFYRQTIQVEWIFLGALLLFWYELERPFAALGFVPIDNYALLIGIPLIGLMVAALIQGFQKLKRADAEKRAEHIAELLALDGARRDVNRVIDVDALARAGRHIEYDLELLRGFRYERNVLEATSSTIAAIQPFRSMPPRAKPDDVRKAGSG